MRAIAAVCAVLWPLLSAAADSTYRVGVGDLLSVKVLGEAEFSGEFRIASDGTIDYPYLRKIDARGKTIEELSGLLTEKLKAGYIADPQVQVEVKEHVSQQVIVLGAVARPGTYVLKAETRLLDLMSQAGGIAGGGGKRVLLLRGQTSGAAPEASSEPQVIDYYRLVHKGDFTYNVVLRGGDVLNVPKANEIFVLGNVGKPGPVTYEENMTILQAVTLAGGPTATASTKSTYVLRQGQENKINVRFDKIMENKEKNFVLQADDVIVIPESFF